MLKELETKIKAGQDITYEEAIACSRLTGRDLQKLLQLAGEITYHFHNNQVDLCAIVNAKSGRCSEDCRYCAQSAYYQTEAEVYPLLSGEQILKRAKEIEAMGVTRFALVTSGRGLSGRDLTATLKILAQLRRQTNLLLCASLGIIGSDKLKALYEAGVTTYHHNLETSRSYFSNICTTHSFEERVSTVTAAKQAGLRVCSGGILSLGETMEQRLELAFELKKLQVDSVPINILNPIKGTPLEKQHIISPLEILHTIALFRLILPATSLRICGGRESALRDLQAMAFNAGITSALVGSYLTTSGRTIAVDKQMITDLGLTI